MRAAEGLSMSINNLTHLLVPYRPIHVVASYVLEISFSLSPSCPLTRPCAGTQNC
jgi:hypothetical protein